MTQPPLSRQIQLLEHELGVSLLKRSSRQVELTPAGKTFFLEAQRLLRLAENAEVMTRRVARGESGLVTLGFTAASSYAFLPRLVSIAKAKLPDTDLVLREMITLDQTEALRSGRIDLGFLRPPVNRYGIAGRRILREPLFLALPRADPLAAKDEVEIADLDHKPFITYSPVEGRYFHDLLAGLFQVAGVNPVYVQYVIQTHSILALVNAGLGVAVVPEAARSLHPEGVVFRPFPPSARAISELFLAWSEENENLAAFVFRDLILREFGDAARTV
jgi:DNA-binding transcriptional LysR family regulator